MKYLKSLFYSLIIAYLPCVLIAVAFLRDDNQISYIQQVYAVFLLSFPFLVAFIVLGAFIGGIMDKREVPTGEMVINIMSDIAALFIIALGFFSLAQRMYISIGISVLLIALWIAKAIIFKRKPEIFSFMKTKVLWIFTVSLIIVFSLAVFLLSR